MSGRALPGLPQGASCQSPNRAVQMGSQEIIHPRQGALRSCQPFRLSQPLRCNFTLPFPELIHLLQVRKTICLLFISSPSRAVAVSLLRAGRNTQLGLCCNGAGSSEFSISELGNLPNTLQGSINFLNPCYRLPDTVSWHLLCPVSICNEF